MVERLKEGFMRKIGFGLLLLGFVIFPAAAQDNRVAITWPPPVYVLAGTVEVRGAVNPPDLQAYFLEVAAYGEASPTWTPVSLPANQPVVNGMLAQFPTTLVPDGVYQLRLHAALRSGQSLYAVVGPLRIANQLQPPAGGSVPALQPQNVAPTPPPTIVSASPTPAPNTAPTQPPRSNPVNPLPLPVGGQVLYFNERAIQAMQTAGMTWVKWQIPYKLNDSNLIPVIRDRVAWSHNAGFKVLFSVVGDVNELAAQGDAFYPLFAADLGQIAALGPDAIEVWNEMNLDREWPRGRINPRAYAEMLKQAYTAIKAVDPQIMVITGAPAPTGAEGAFGLSRVWNDDRYYAGMANAGVAQYADCIGVHYNEGILPPNLRGGDPRQPDYPTRYFPSMIQRAAFPFRGTTIPLCFTELGYLSPEGYGRLPGGFAWAANTSVQEQAAWLRDAVKIAAETSSTRIALIIVFNVDFDRYDADPQAGYAIIRKDGTCPTCETLASLRQP
jgi:hypothetical protein